MKTSLFAGPAIAGALLVTGIVLFNFGLRSQAMLINPDDPAQVALGRQVYAAHCAMCHGAKLEGEPNWAIRKPNGRLPAPPHDRSGHTWHHPDRDLITMTKKSLAGLEPGYQSDMPAFEGVLTDEQIVAVLAFIESNWPTEIRERQRALTRAAQ